jgi:hypothetical protein
VPWIDASFSDEEKKQSSTELSHQHHGAAQQPAPKYKHGGKTANER